MLQERGGGRIITKPLLCWALLLPQIREVARVQLVVPESVLSRCTVALGILRAAVKTKTVATSTFHLVAPTFFFDFNSTSFAFPKLNVALGAFQVK